MHDFLRLVNLCKGHRVILQTHNIPDPDAIASAYGVQELLQEYNIPSQICYDGVMDKLGSLKMITLLGIELSAYSELQKDLEESDYVVCVDSQKNSGNITDIIGDEVACIDHHPTFVPVEYQYKDIQMVGACSSIIASYYKTLGVRPSVDVATALLFGIKIDTLQFSRNVTHLDVEMFDFLLDYVDSDKLAELERKKLELLDLKAYGEVIRNIEVFDNVGISYVPYGLPDSMIAILSDFILSLVEVDISIVYSLRKDGFKFSVRSELDHVHAGKLARQALDGLGNGGGHPSMAGGLISSSSFGLLGGVPEDYIKDRFLKQIFLMSATANTEV